MIKAISKDDWAIKTKIDDGLLKNWLDSPTPGNRTALKLAYFAKNQKTHASITRKDNRLCDNECKDCREHDDELKKVKDELKRGMCFAIQELLSCGTDHMLKPANVCLLGGGSHMIFIQDALKEALTEALKDSNGITCYTITITNGTKYYTAIYEDGNQITTANFLAYAAALFGEQQRMSGEKTKSTEAGNESAVVYPRQWVHRRVSELDTATYGFEVNLKDEQKRYIMLPERKYNDQNAYILVPTPIVISENGQNIYKNIKILPREKAANSRSGEYIEVSESDLQGLSCQNIGPKAIPDGMAFAVGIKFSNNYSDSDDKKLQIYLYQAVVLQDEEHDQAVVLQDEEHVVLPNDGEKPYFAEGELTEERKRQLKDADYDFNLTFKQFMERSGQNLKC